MFLRVQQQKKKSLTIFSICRVFGRFFVLFFQCFAQVSQNSQNKQTINKKKGQKVTDQISSGR